MRKYMMQDAEHIADRMWEVSGLVNSIYAGRGIKVSSVDPFSYHTKVDPNTGLFDSLLPYSTNVYVGCLVWDTALTMTISVLGVAIVLPIEMQGQRVVFDNVSCLDGEANAPFQFTGWKTTMDGAYDAVPDIAASAGISDVAPSGGAIVFITPGFVATPAGANMYDNYTGAIDTIAIMKVNLPAGVVQDFRPVLVYATQPEVIGTTFQQGNAGSFSPVAIRFTNNPPGDSVTQVKLQRRNPVTGLWVDYLFSGVLGAMSGVQAAVGVGGGVNGNLSGGVPAAQHFISPWSPNSWFDAMVLDGDCVGTIIRVGNNSVSTNILQHNGLFDAPAAPYVNRSGTVNAVTGDQPVGGVGGANWDITFDATAFPGVNFLVGSSQDILWGGSGTPYNIGAAMDALFGFANAICFQPSPVPTP